MPKATVLLPIAEQPARGEVASRIRFGDLISALSYALDLTEGQPMGHAVRACMIGMRIAREAGVPAADRGELYYALLLKDAGCSSNASRLFHILNADEIRAKRDLKTTDWTRVGWESLQYALRHVSPGRPFLERVRTLLRVGAQHQRESCELVKIRCERGASIARRMGFPETVAASIYSLDEHWDGLGYPDGLAGRTIPLFSRIMNLAQTLEVLLTNRGPAAAIEIVRQRRGRWFDPDLVKAAAALAKSGSLWKDLASERIRDLVVALEPEARQTPLTEADLDGICLAFADIIDAKSPFTYRHSNGVADATVAIARQLCLSAPEIDFLRRAALLHDIGKLGVSNEILEKPGRLADAEWESVKLHPYYGFEILRRICGFETIGEVAAAHHEKLDGSGYFRRLTAEQLPLPARIVAVADIYDALTAKRPYRDAMPVENALQILGQESGAKIDPQCVEALMIANLNPESAMSAGLANLSQSLNDQTAPQQVPGLHEPCLEEPRPSEVGRGRA